MARLIVLNGPPGVGKSTQARRYADEHPFTLIAEIDAVRRLIGHWRDDPNRAGLLARAATLQMARAHLEEGLDVVIPQFLGNPKFLLEAERVAEDVGAQFFEFVLMDDRDTVIRRFHERNDADPAYDDAAWLVERLGGDDTLARMYDRLLQVLSARASAHLIHCHEGNEDDVHRQLREVIDG